MYAQLYCMVAALADPTTPVSAAHPIKAQACATRFKIKNRIRISPQDGGSADALTQVNLPEVDWSAARTLLA